MTETGERPFDERLAEVKDWLGKIGEEGIVSEIDPMLIKGVLEGMGASTEVSEEAKSSLERYSNYYKRPGLNALWGTDKVKGFVRWIKGDFIPQYEERIGRELPTLWDPKTETFDSNKHSGMLQFLGELTAFAEGVKPFEEYKRLTESRVGKGIKFESGDPNEPYKPSKNASFPAEFPLKAINYLLDHKAE